MKPRIKWPVRGFMLAHIPIGCLQMRSINGYKRPQPAHSLADLLSTPNFTPSKEQQAVISAVRDGKSLVVKAYAGTGKTATACEAAKQSGRRGRMVVFNASAKRDAQRRMPSYINVTTGHGMAHDAIIKPSAVFTKKLQWVLDQSSQRIPGALIARHLNLPNMPEHHCTSRQLAMAIQSTLGVFLISSDKTITTKHILAEALPMELRLNPGASRSAELQTHIVEHTRRIWGSMSSDREQFPIDHDGYLKLLHLRETELSEPDSLWLLDEYQDTNPVIEAIINNQAGQKVFIGDPYQAIYGWRGAINAMSNKISEGLPVLPLSHSFRFNHQIAGSANLLLRSMGEQTPIIGQPHELKQMNLHRGHTVLVRGNLSMIDVAHQYNGKDQCVYVPGKLPRDTRVKLESALALYEGRLNDVKIGTLKQMESWQNFSDIAKDMAQKNPEYQTLKALIEKHHDNLPDLIRKCSRSFDELPESSQRVTIITAHRAKGREWSYVRLAPDLALPKRIMDKIGANAPLNAQERESINLLYVAITRCKKSITLPPAIKNNLSQLNSILHNSDEDEANDKPTQSSQPQRKMTTEEFIKTFRKYN